MKKFIAILLASIMVIGLFAGCAPKEPAKPTETQAAKPTEKPAEKETEAPAEEIVELKWVTVGGGMPENYDAWKAAMDAYLEEKIGVHLNMEVIGWGDWDQRRNMIVSTNEPYDIMFTNNGTFYKDVNMGAFAKLDDLVDQVPALKDFIPAEYWDACRVNGSLYAVPTYKDSSATFFFVYDQDLADAAGADYENAHTLQDVEKCLEKMYATETENHLANTPVFLCHQGGVDAVYGSKYDDISAGCPAIGVSYKGGEAKVVSVFEQQDVIDDLATLQDMYKKGYINSDANILPEVPKYNPCGVAQGWPAAAKTVWGPNMGIDGLNCIAIQWGDTVLSNATVQGSLNCISASCAHPEKALQLLELVNTDSKVRDMLFYGLEGDNFEYTADGKVHKNTDTTDWTMAGYTQGTFFNVSMTDDVDFNQWDEVKAQNEKAVASPILGFSLNKEPISDQLDAIGAIFTEWRPALMTGADEGAREQMLSAMKDAGLDEVITEIQSQIDAWIAK